ncbi:MAG TPA: SH3 domain-containing protein [Chloroflexota bacterium]|jgi:hypothetical protein
MRALMAVLLLAVPLLVIVSLPRLFELAGSVPGIAPAPVASVPTPFRLADPTPVAQRFAALEEQPPPTLAPAATPTPAPRPTPTGERVIVTNTGGIGAVLRAEPVSGRQVASLREQLELTVLERRTVGGAEWLRVRTAEGQEGWVLGLVARPASSRN